MHFPVNMKVSVWRLAGLALAFTFYLVMPCSADLIDDLQPLDGYVVMARDNEFIIDLDGQDGVAVGDIFSVMGEAEEIIHPVTKKAIGELDTVKGVLKVVRIGDGYSFARPLDKSSAIKRGDPIHRYSSLKAIFWDYDEKNEALYNHLQNKLSSLKWQEYDVAQQQRPTTPAPSGKNEQVLIFIAQDDTLEVRDGDFGLVKKYSLSGAMLPSQTEAPVLSPADSKQQNRNRTLSTSTLTALPEENRAVISYGSATAASPLLNNTMMADVLNQGDRRLLAVTDGSRITVYTMDEPLQQLAEGRLDRYGKILAVQWWQPDTNGPLYLAALGWTDEQLDSTIFVFEDGRLRIVTGGLNTILGSFDIDRDGRPETLLSQRFDAETFFGRRINEIYWHNSELQQRSTSLQLPSKFTVIGGQLADLTGDGKLEAIYVRDGTLRIYSGKKRLYASAKQMGGSLSVLTYKVDPSLLDYRTTSVFFEIAPVIVDIDHDGISEVIVVSSDQSAIKAPGIASTIDQSRLLVLNYERGGFLKGFVGDPVGAAIQGLDVTDNQLLLVTTETGSPLEQGGGSRIHTIRLAQ